MKTKLAALAALAALSLLASCVAGSSASADTANDSWFMQLLLGFWHGLISIITLIVEAVDRYVVDVPGTWRMFEGSANSPFYDLGFLVGAWSPFTLIVRRKSASTH